jgi:hypothetical protein
LVEVDQGKPSYTSPLAISFIFFKTALFLKTVFFKKNFSFFKCLPFKKRPYIYITHTLEMQSVKLYLDSAKRDKQLSSAFCYVWNIKLQGTDDDVDGVTILNAGEIKNIKQ